MRPFALAGVVASALRVAHAQPPHTPPRAAPAPGDNEAAKAHFLAGSAYYEQANYADAVKEFNEAYRLSKRTDLLYNIAVCYERLDDYDNAIATLQKYLTDRPDAKDRVTIESRIANMTKQRDARRANPQPQPQPTQPPPQLTQAVPVPPPEPVTRAHLWWLPGTVVTVVGVGLLITALGTGVAAN